MMSEPLQPLIETYAGKHHLPPEIVFGIVLTESAGNPWAIRFEPAFLDRYVPDDPELFGPVSVETERIARATSWGPMQIMGQVARERGFERAFLSALCQPDLGIDMGCAQLAYFRSRFEAEHGFDAVIAAYNAGSPRYTDDGAFVNQTYLDKVMHYAEQFKPGQAVV